MARQKEFMMQRLIDETIAIASKNFQGFGFDEEQIDSLLEAGKRDLAKELKVLQTLLEKEPVELDTLNLSLHALKGLLLNMGNTAIAEMFTELRQGKMDDKALSEIKLLLNE